MRVQGGAAAGLTMGLSAQRPLRQPRVHDARPCRRRTRRQESALAKASPAARVLEVGLGRKPCGFAILSSITGWKRLIKPWTGQAAASPPRRSCGPRSAATPVEHADFPHVGISADLHAF